MSELRDSVKRRLYVSLTVAGRLTHPVRSRNAEHSDDLRVLMYHKVTDERPNPIAVGVEAFAEQQRYLHEHYAVVSLERVRHWLLDGEPLPPRAVLLTFDDGYRDNLLNAYPILSEYSHPAVLFVPTAFVGSPKPLPHDRNLPVANPTLSWREVGSMLDVFEVGAHGRSHRVLTRLPDEEARREILDSKHELEENLGVRIRAFSYPKGSIGDFDKRIEGYVREAGFDVAFSTLPGSVSRERALHRPLALHRHNVEDYGLAYFRALLDGSADLLALKDTRAGYRLKQLIGGSRG
jgi:peptidoglycan/xylan/chitin deacetylase (PgdA/CDA1 family)